MYQAPVTVIVEGKEDRAAYESLCRDVLGEDLFRVKTIQAVAANPLLIGKNGVKTMHAEFSRAGSLTGQHGGRKAAAVFVVDKDADDVHGQVVSCPHLLYTEYYNLENYLYVFGDLVKVATIVSLAEAAAVRGRIPDATEWRKKVAARCRKWIVLCLLATHPDRKGLRAGAYYSMTVPRWSECGDIPAEYGEWRAIVREAFPHLDDLDFDKLEASMDKVVTDSFTTGTFDTVFQGKWYEPLLREELAAIGVTDIASPTEQFRSGLLQSLAAGWAPSLRVGLERIKAMVAV